LHSVEAIQQRKEEDSDSAGIGSKGIIIDLCEDEASTQVIKD
jgi:hypothetical protein